MESKHSGVDDVVGALHNWATRRGLATVAHKELLLLLDVPHDAEPVPARLRPSLIIDQSLSSGRIGTVTSSDPRRHVIPAVAVMGSDPPPITPQQLADSGTRLLSTSSPELPAALRRWLRLAPSRPALLHTTIHSVRIRSCDTTAARRQVAAALIVRTQAAVLLDLTDLSPPQAHRFLETFGEWLGDQPVRLGDTAAPLHATARRLLHGAQ